MNPDPSIPEQVRFYDRWNEQHRAGRLDDVEPEIRRRGLEVLHQLEELELDDPAILEVGCGTGWLTEALCELGEVTAIDLSPRAIEIARGRGVEANWIAGDFFAEEFPREAFDVCVCIETLFYVSEQERFVEKLASLLRPNGVLALTAIHKFVYDRRSDIGPPTEGQVRHWLSRAELNQLLSRHFEIYSSFTVEPRGDRGILRFVNSYKANALLDRIFSPDAVRRAKERAGLGGGVVIIARRRPE